MSVPTFSLPSELEVRRQAMELAIGLFSASSNPRTDEFEMLSGSTGCTNSNIRDHNSGEPMPGVTAQLRRVVGLYRGYGAASCALGFCLKTYTAIVNAGVINEILLEETEPEEFFD
jgi:hypothetical protein